MHHPGRNIMKRRIMPGLWEDVDGAAHFSIPEILQHLDMPDTPENREEATRMCQDLVRENLPGAKIIFRPKPDFDE